MATSKGKKGSGKPHRMSRRALRPAARKANREGLALLRVLAAVSGDDRGALKAAETPAARGIPAPVGRR